MYRKTAKNQNDDKMISFSPLFFQTNAEEDSSLRDESYLSKNLEAQVGLKKNLLKKYNIAKAQFEDAQKKLEDEKALAKLEAYKNWRLEEDRKGKAQDDRGRNLVKVMLQAAKSDPNPIEEPKCNVLGNVDGNYFFFFFQKNNNIGLFKFGKQQPVK